MKTVKTIDNDRSVWASLCCYLYHMGPVLGPLYLLGIAVAGHFAARMFAQ